MRYFTQEYGKPPNDVEREYQTLVESLDHNIPPKHLDQNLLIATWNIREFGGLTEKWQASSRDSPKRDIRALRCVSEIVSRFDVIALQEVTGTLKALRHRLKALGPHWGLLLTDVTKGDVGGGERMAFVYDTRKVKPSGLACELVVPTDEKDVKEGGLRSAVRQNSLRCQFYLQGLDVHPRHRSHSLRRWDQTRR